MEKDRFFMPTKTNTKDNSIITKHMVMVSTYKKMGRYIKESGATISHVVTDLNH